MASTDTWQASTSFSDRLAMIVNITSSYRRAHPEATPADSRKESGALENEAFVYATTHLDYELRCEAIVDELASSLPIAEVEYDDRGPEKAASRLGTYDNAVHHENGLFSEIFKASRSNGDSGCFASTLVALKVTVPSMMSPPHDSEKEAHLLRMAQSEERHVIPLLDTFWQAGGRFVLVFEFMHYDLGQLLGQRRISRIQSKRCLGHMFKALEHIHSLGIVHRDVKPTNIMLRSLDGPAFLADFGIAWKDGVRGAEPAARKITDVGTSHYRPPELLFGNTAYGPALDMWAAGCLVAETLCLRGRSLFDLDETGSELALVNSHFQSLGTPNDDVWPEASSFRDWGKMQFYDYRPKPWPELLPDCDDNARDLVSRLVVFESASRWTASEALRHPLFTKAQV